MVMSLGSLGSLSESDPIDELFKSLLEEDPSDAEKFAQLHKPKTVVSGNAVQGQDQQSSFNNPDIDSDFFKDLFGSGESAGWESVIGETDIAMTTESGSEIMALEGGEGGFGGLGEGASELFSGGSYGGVPSEGVGGSIGGEVSSSSSSSAGGSSGGALAGIIAAIIAAQHILSNQTDTEFEGVKTDDAFGGHFATEPWFAFLADKMGWEPTAGERMDAAVENEDWSRAWKRYPAASTYWADPTTAWIYEAAKNDVGEGFAAVVSPHNWLTEQIGEM